MEPVIFQRTLDACCRRIGSWRVPPNWSAAQWSEEVVAVAQLAACEAESDFNSSHGVTFGSFVYYRVMARALTRYRQEWVYALHCFPTAPDDGPENDSCQSL